MAYDELCRNAAFTGITPGHGCELCAQREKTRYRTAGDLCRAIENFTDDRQSRTGIAVLEPFQQASMKPGPVLDEIASQFAIFLEWLGQFPVDHLLETWREKSGFREQVFLARCA